jgi:dolichyl-phosphate-mannose-protein mannosyltransferase
MVVLARHDWIFYRLRIKVSRQKTKLAALTLQTFSVKLIGLFVTALVGLYTIEDLWEKFGDLRMPVVCFSMIAQVRSDKFSMQRDQLRHWGARIACLIILPILVYMASFKLHFLILNHTGPGDAQMPSLFQANLEGNDFGTSPLGEAIIFPVLV